jgi:hypothetical protein
MIESFSSSKAASEALARVVREFEMYRTGFGSAHFDRKFDEFCIAAHRLKLGMGASALRQHLELAGLPEDLARVASRKWDDARYLLALYDKAGWAKGEGEGEGE